MSSPSVVRDVLRRSFWFLPALALAAGLGLGFLMPFLDSETGVDLGLFPIEELSNARSVLETVATVTVSVAGIIFSVTVVALTLASQQLSPRVLRTFQANRLAQGTLAVFVGTFAYALIVLTRLGATGEVPQLSMALAIGAAVAAFGLFVAFIHDIVESLQASTLIRRIAADGQSSVALDHPRGIGGEPDNPAAAERRVAELVKASTPHPGRAPRAGFVVSVDGEALIEAAREHDGIVVQRTPLGDFAVTGALLVEVWAPEGAERLAEAAVETFALSGERTIVQDIAFPVRQLADIALRGLSPSLNDPTTAENAMDSLADTLVRFAARPVPSNVRLDEDGAPRYVALTADLDDLVRLGFDQVRVKCAEYPVVAVQLLRLLAEIARAAREAGVACEEVGRQARLLREGASGALPAQADEDAVAEAYGRPHAGRRQ
ncbi:MAG: DUF2254 domain-containing protein [Thermoleophilaceae bacterium]